jgi:hypothetical protein
MQAESVCFERTYKSFESRRFFSELFAAGRPKHPLSLQRFRLRENGKAAALVRIRLVRKRKTVR